jgi:hypothetical protein
MTAVMRTRSIDMLIDKSKVAQMTIVLHFPDDQFPPARAHPLLEIQASGFIAFKGIVVYIIDFIPKLQEPLQDMIGRALLDAQRELQHDRCLSVVTHRQHNFTLETPVTDLGLRDGDVLQVHSKSLRASPVVGEKTISLNFRLNGSQTHKLSVQPVRVFCGVDVICS